MMKGSNPTLLAAIDKVTIILHTNKELHKGRTLTISIRPNVICIAIICKSAFCYTLYTFAAVIGIKSHFHTNIFIQGKNMRITF